VEKVDFTVQAVYLPGRRLLLRDVDGNRYEIPNYRALDARSLDLLEQFVV